MTLDAVDLDDPWVYPLRLCEEDVVTFIEFPERAFRDEPFHDRRIAGRYPSAGSLPADRVVEWHAGREAHPPPAFIFHHAFTLSTLLSRMLDDPDHTLVVREPSVLTDLSAIDLHDGDALARPEMAGLVRALVALVGRTGRPEQRAVVKGCDSVTQIIPALLSDGGSGVLLYSDLDPFVLACLGTGIRRRWTRDRVDALLQWDLPDELGLVEPSGLSDGEVAACLWAVQITRFEGLLGRLSGRLRPVHCERLLHEPVETASEIAHFLGLPAPGRVTVTLGRHAKSGEIYGPQERAAGLNELAGRYAEELAHARGWFDRTVGEVRLGSDVVTSAPGDRAW